MSAFRRIRVPITKIRRSWSRIMYFYTGSFIMKRSLYSLVGTPLLGESPLTRKIPCTRNVILLGRPWYLFFHCVVIRSSSQT